MEFVVKKVIDGNKCGDDIVREIYDNNGRLMAKVIICGYFHDVWGVDINLWSGNNANDKRCYFYPTDKNKTKEEQIEDCVIGIQSQVLSNIKNGLYEYNVIV